MAIKELIHRRIFMGGAALSLLALAGAATTLATQSTSAQTPPTPGAVTSSNEDSAHEAGETPEQEAAEDNGTARHGGKGGGTNEDAAHEANETPGREAAEHARGSNSSPSQPSGGSTTPAQ